jgi:hypothetical protein
MPNCETVHVFSRVAMLVRLRWRPRPVFLKVFKNVVAEDVVLQPLFKPVAGAVAVVDRTRLLSPVAQDDGRAEPAGFRRKRYRRDLAEVLLEELGRRVAFRYGLSVMPPPARS